MAEEFASTLFYGGGTAPEEGLKRSRYTLVHVCSIRAGGRIQPLFSATPLRRRVAKTEGLTRQVLKCNARVVLSATSIVDDK